MRSWNVARPLMRERYVSLSCILSYELQPEMKRVCGRKHGSPDPLSSNLTIESRDCIVIRDCEILLFFYFFFFSNIFNASECKCFMMMYRCIRSGYKKKRRKMSNVERWSDQLKMTIAIFDFLISSKISPGNFSPSLLPRWINNLF